MTEIIVVGGEEEDDDSVAKAALEVAEIAQVEAALALAEATGEDEEGGHGCGEDCPCRQENRELRAMLVSLSDKYDEDMDLISQVLDELLGPEEAEEEAEVEEVSLEPEEEHAASSEPAPSESSTGGHAEAGSRGDREAESKTEKPEEHEHRRKPAASGGLRFRRGRR